MQKIKLYLKTVKKYGRIYLIVADLKTISNKVKPMTVSKCMMIIVQNLKQFCKKDCPFKNCFFVLAR